MRATLLLPLLLLLSANAQALTEDITALFRPDPANPSLNEFVNTTPVTGMCAWHAPAKCKALGIFSLRNYEWRANSNGPILKDETNPRRAAMWKVPSEWRDVQVIHTETGHTETVQMRIAGIGQKWFSTPSVDVWAHPGHPLLSWWWRLWAYAPAPCQGIDYAQSNYRDWAMFFWIVPENVGTCSRAPGTGDVNVLFYEHTEYAYALKTPNPLKMTAGQYTGSLSYSIGPGADFDLGDVMVPTDNNLTFNFTLEVDHHLRIEIPPGGNRIQLEPQGGWQAWQQNGRKPSRLFRDQTVNLWSSSQFKMTLECAEPMGNTCSMRNAAGHQVPLDVAVSLPANITDAAGRSVNRLPLTLDGSGTEMFQPSMYVDRKPSTLHFEIKADGVAQMLEQPGSTYSGAVTVVWDSEV